MKICDTSKLPAVVRKRSAAACEAGIPMRGEGGEDTPSYLAVSNIINYPFDMDNKYIVVVVVIEQITIHRY